MIERLKERYRIAIEVGEKGIEEFEKMNYTKTAQSLRELVELYKELLADLEKETGGNQNAIN